MDGIFGRYEAYMFRVVDVAADVSGSLLAGGDCLISRINQRLPHPRLSRFYLYHVAVILTGLEILSHEPRTP